MSDDLRKLIEAVEADDDAAFRRYNRAVFSTPCQDIALQLREDDSYRAYRGSLDAAIALCEALLPGWKVAGLHQEDRGLWWAELRQGHITSYSRVVVAPNSFDAPNPALALLLAVLRARLMEMENE